MQLENYELTVLQSTLESMRQFQETFGRKLSKDVIAELHVAIHLSLSLAKGVNQAGYDAVAKDGTRYQIKERSLSTHNIDVNNFDFDFLVLVNLDDAYHVLGMWQIDAKLAKTIARHRQYKGIDKWQIRQSTLKQRAVQLI